MSADTETLSRKVRDEVIKPEQSTLISPDRQSPSLLRREAAVNPRFELFHFVFSVCSQKVRGTLMEKGVTFGSNELTILPPQNENYCPQYVRLRLRSEAAAKHRPVSRSEEHTSELQSLMRISYAVFCLKKQTIHIHNYKSA